MRGVQTWEHDRMETLNALADFADWCIGYIGYTCISSLFS